MTLRLRRYSAADEPTVDGIRERVRAEDGEIWIPGADEVAEVDGEAVGFTWSSSWAEDDGTRLYLLLGWVDPAYRGQGLGQQILSHQEEQARAHAAANPWTGPTMLGANIEESQPDSLALHLAAGYQAAFTRVRLSLPLTAPDPVELPVGVELRTASPADHRAVFEANGEVFSDRGLGYVRETFEGFEADAAADFPDHDLWTLAWSGDRLAGWVISGISGDGTADTPWVGVRPDWRRRGLASALLRLNHQRLFAHGVRITSLWTIAENPTGSVTLYEKLGYRIVARQPRYRKPV